jgi:hypothetical protein
MRAAAGLRGWSAPLSAAPLLQGAPPAVQRPSVAIPLHGTAPLPSPGVTATFAGGCVEAVAWAPCGGVLAVAARPESGQRACVQFYRAFADGRVRGGGGAAGDGDCVSAFASEGSGARAAEGRGSDNVAISGDGDDVTAGGGGTEGGVSAAVEGYRVGLAAAGERDKDGAVAAFRSDGNGSVVDSDRAPELEVVAVMPLAAHGCVALAWAPAEIGAEMLRLAVAMADGSVVAVALGIASLTGGAVRSVPVSAAAANVETGGRSRRPVVIDARPVLVDRTKLCTRSLLWLADGRSLALGRADGTLAMFDVVAAGDGGNGLEVDALWCVRAHKGAVLALTEARGKKGAHALVSTGSDCWARARDVRRPSVVTDAYYEQHGWANAVVPLPADGELGVFCVTSHGLVRCLRFTGGGLVAAPREQEVSMTTSLTLQRGSLQTAALVFNDAKDGGRGGKISSAIVLAAGSQGLVHEVCLVRKLVTDQTEDVTGLAGAWRMTRRHRIVCAWRAVKCSAAQGVSQTPELAAGTSRVGAGERMAGKDASGAEKVIVNGVDANAGHRGEKVAHVVGARLDEGKKEAKHGREGKTVANGSGRNGSFDDNGLANVTALNASGGDDSRADTDDLGERRPAYHAEGAGDDGQEAGLHVPGERINERSGEQKFVEAVAERVGDAATVVHKESHSSADVAKLLWTGCERDSQDAGLNAAMGQEVAVTRNETDEAGVAMVMIDRGEPVAGGVKKTAAPTSVSESNELLVAFNTEPLPYNCRLNTALELMPGLHTELDGAWGEAFDARLSVTCLALDPNSNTLAVCTGAGFIAVTKFASPAPPTPSAPLPVGVAGRLQSGPAVRHGSSVSPTGRFSIGLYEPEKSLRSPVVLTADESGRAGMFARPPSSTVRFGVSKSRPRVATGNAIAKLLEREEARSIKKAAREKKRADAARVAEEKRAAVAAIRAIRAEKEAAAQRVLAAQAERQRLLDERINAHLAKAEAVRQAMTAAVLARKAAVAEPVAEERRRNAEAEEKRRAAAAQEKRRATKTAKEAARRASRVQKDAAIAEKAKRAVATAEKVAAKEAASAVREAANLERKRQRDKHEVSRAEAGTRKRGRNSSLSLPSGGAKKVARRGRKPARGRKEASGGGEDSDCELTDNGGDVEKEVTHIGGEFVDGGFAEGKQVAEETGLVKEVVKLVEAAEVASSKQAKKVAETDEVEELKKDTVGSHPPVAPPDAEDGLRWRRSSRARRPPRARS